MDGLVVGMQQREGFALVARAQAQLAPSLGLNLGFALWISTAPFLPAINCYQAAVTVIKRRLGII